MGHAALLYLAVGAFAVAVVHPSAPDEPWSHRLTCVVPLAAVAGAVLALAGSAG